jgi:hypothetical protein
VSGIRWCIMWKYSNQSSGCEWCSGLVRLGVLSILKWYIYIYIYICVCVCVCVIIYKIRKLCVLTYIQFKVSKFIVGQRHWGYVSIFLKKERTLHGNTPAFVGFLCRWPTKYLLQRKMFRTKVVVCFTSLGAMMRLRTVNHNLPVVAPVPSPIRSMLPSDFNLFGPLKKHLAGMRFATDADVKQAITSWLSTLNTYFSYAGIQALVPRWDRRLNVDGEYAEVWCISYATCAINTSKWQ